MAPSPSSPLWEELARCTVGRQSPGGSSLVVSMTRRTARELGGTPQLSLRSKEGIQLAARRWEDATTCRRLRLLGKPFPSWTSGLLEYSSESFPLALEGREDGESSALVGCALGGAVSCWQGTRGTSPLLSAQSPASPRSTVVGLDSAGREETSCHSEHAVHGKKRALLSPVIFGVAAQVRRRVETSSLRAGNTHSFILSGHHHRPRKESGGPRA